MEIIEDNMSISIIKSNSIIEEDENDSNTKNNELKAKTQNVELLDEQVLNYLIQNNKREILSKKLYWEDF